MTASIWTVCDGAFWCDKNSERHKNKMALNLNYEWYFTALIIKSEKKRDKCVHICCWNLWFGNSKVLHGWIGIQLYEFGLLFACILESYQAFGEKHEIQGWAKIRSNIVFCTYVFSLSHFQDYKLTGFNVNQNHEWKTKKLSSAWKRQCEFSCKCWHFNDTQKNMNSSFTLNTLFSLGNLFNISFWFLLFVIMILTSRNINSMRVIFLLRTRNTKSEHKIENYSNGK